jgi:hypothetical protein
MTDIDAVIADDRKALAAFLAIARPLSPGVWSTPPAAGKWSPAQIAQHLALSYELSLAAIHGTFPGAAAPRLMRPLIRTFFLKPVLKNGRFGKGAKAPGPFQPSAQPGPPDVVLPRLETAVGAFEQAVKTEIGADRPAMDHPFFGKVDLADYVRLQVIHTNHHRNQLSTGIGV